MTPQPPGLSIDSESGAITGTPTATGSFAVRITALDPRNQQTATAPLTIIVNAALTIPTSSTLPNGALGGVYAGVAFSASGGTQPYTFSGQAPAGLTISPSGALSGTPNATGIFNFNVTLTDSFGYQVSRTFSITISVPLSIPMAPSLAAGIIGMGYVQIISATGGSPPYTFSVPAGRLPPGLALNTVGLLSGTPLMAGIFNFNVQAVDRTGQPALTSFSITITAALVIPTASPLVAGTADTSYSQVITATGGTLPYAFSISYGNLPPGLTLNPNGTLNGTPATAGTFNFNVQISDGAGLRTLKAFSVTIAAGLSMSTTSPLAGGTTLVSYSQTISASGGTPPYTFSISSGGAPPGLALSTGGVLSGTPTVAGISSFDVTATDSAKVSIARTYQVTILAGVPLLQVSPVSLSFSATQGGDSPSAQSVVLLATGSSAVGFSIVTDTARRHDWW